MLHLYKTIGMIHAFHYDSLKLIYKKEGIRMEHFGIISLIPVLTVVILAFVTRRTFEPLLIGSLVGFVLLEGTGFFPAWLDAVYFVMMDGVTVWIILVCGLFGSLIKLLEKSGGALGFSAMATRHTKSKKASLIVTWILGILVFVDDYLNALSVGAAMRKVTDHYRVSREFLAYVINSTGAAVCVLIPFSTWSAFMAGQLEANNVLANGSGTGAYIATIPYILYGWVAVLVVPLFALRIIPRFGPMKKAELRAEQSGQVFPDSEIQFLEDSIEAEAVANGVNGVPTARTVPPRVINFAVPMLLLAGVTIYTEDMLLGVMMAIVCCAVLFIPQKLMSLNAFFDHSLEGFKDMILVLGIIVAAFFLQQANEGLGLTPFVIETVEPLMSAALLPAISFAVVGFLAFATGSFWGVAAIAFPIIIPLAASIGVDQFLVSGAIISAAAFGSHTCFYGDAVTLTCASAQIKNMDYAKTAIPLVVVPTVISIILFVILGTIMA
jgi:tetracycline resistance efflux pump